MEFQAIMLARVTVYFEVETLDPRGGAQTLAVFQGLGKKFSFEKIPRTFEEIDFNKGIAFSLGRMGDVNIDTLTLFLHGLVVDTRSSTDDCEKIVAEFVRFATEASGATISISRRLFHSQFLFRSTMQMARLHPTLKKVTDYVSDCVSRDMNQALTFDPGIVLRADWTTRIVPAPFIIERRAELPYSENTYFASAPMRTKEHIELVTEFEAALLAS